MKKQLNELIQMTRHKKNLGDSLPDFRRWISTINIQRLKMAYPFILLLFGYLIFSDVRYMNQFDESIHFGGIWLLAGHLLLITAATTVLAILKIRPLASEDETCHFHTMLFNIAYFFFLLSFVLISIGRLETSQSIISFFAGTAILTAFAFQGNIASIFTYGLNLLTLLGLLNYLEQDLERLFTLMVNSINVTLFLWVASRF